VIFVPEGFALVGTTSDGTIGAEGEITIIFDEYVSVFCIAYSS